MALITPDFSEAQDKLIPVGVYNARVVKTDAKKSQKGDTYVMWTLQLFGAEGDYEEFNDYKLWHNTMCSGVASGMLKKFVKAVTGEEPTPSFDTDDLLGAELAVTIAHKIYEGEPKPEVKAVAPRTE